MHSLCPLNEFLLHLPLYLECNPEMAEEVHNLLSCTYHILYHGMALCSIQWVQYIEKKLKSVPGNYDESIITDPKPIIEAQEAFTALSL
ncbi:hypothetical protein FBU31_000903 [Coemansia sp. 'formosensis']|nr:hypothetical protein FBU31_000903 [Coemansia sp. 'formosensis']